MVTFMNRERIVKECAKMDKESLIREVLLQNYFVKSLAYILWIFIWLVVYYDSRRDPLRDYTIIHILIFCVLPYFCVLIARFVRILKRRWILQGKLEDEDDLNNSD